jgi:hypothetical protein
MIYEFFCGIPVAVGAVLALVMGLFITLERLEDWAADALMRKAKEKQFGTPRITINSHWWNWRKKGQDTQPNP